MIIIEDKANKEGLHKIKNAYWKSQGIEVIRHPLPVGDYILMNEKVKDMLDRKAKRGIEPKKMDFLGTYNITVDSKANVDEICNNICGKSHARFRDECILAQNNGIKLYVLVENKENIHEVEDVFKWKNPRLRRYNKIKAMHDAGKWQAVALPKKPPTEGKTLAKAMLTMAKKYGVEFVFCHPKDAGAKVIELLTERGN